MDRRVSRVVELLEMTWRTPVRVAELASGVGLGPSRLEHLFRAHARISIRDFVRERRLTHAAELLATTEERISTIAYSVGFANASNFNHAFRKRFGVSPREYRGRQQECGAEKAEDTR